MKLPLLILCLIVALSHFAHGQQHKIESLMAIVKKDPAAEALADLGIIYLRDGKIEKAHELFETCIKNAIDDDEKLAQIYAHIGTACYFSGWTFEAEDYTLKSLEKAYVINDTALILVQSGSLAFFYGQENQIQKSNELYEKILPLTKSIWLLEGLHMNLSHNYLKQGKFYEAIVVLKKAQTYFNQNPQYVDPIYSYLHIHFGKAFVGLNQPDSAIIHVQQALAIANKNNLILEEYFELLGHYNRLVSKKREAAIAYNKALAHHHKSDLTNRLDVDYLVYVDSLAKTYQELSRCDSAIYFLNFSKTRLSEIRDHENKKRMEQN